MTDIPEALVPQVAQLRATRAAAVAYGQTDVVAAADRQLADLGIAEEDQPAEEKPTEEKPAQTPEETPEKPTIPDARAAASPPEGRTATNPAQQTTATPKGNGK